MISFGLNQIRGSDGCCWNIEKEVENLASLSALLSARMPTACSQVADQLRERSLSRRRAESRNGEPDQLLDCWSISLVVIDNIDPPVRCSDGSVLEEAYYRSITEISVIWWYLFRTIKGGDGGDVYDVVY